MERWQQIEALYQQARDASNRERVLAAADPELRREVEALLAQEQPSSESQATTATMTIGGETIAQLGPYKIEAPLGKGGMGEVFRAYDTRLHRTVAIKVLPRDKMADSERKRRFLQEARAASALSHPNIVTIYDVASDHGVDYLVMECVPGKSLDKLIPGDGMPLEQTIGYANQMASALAAAHAAGIVHRDIKPSNVIVTPEGVVKILDFGLAKLTERSSEAAEEPSLTEAGVVMGTMAYMSPEQARAEKVDARTDLFSFGAVLYEMATGRRAFPSALDRTPPSVKSLSSPMRSIVVKLLETDRDLRYQTAAAVAADLKSLEPATEGKPSPRRWVAAAAVLAVLCVIAAVGLWPHSPAGRDQWMQLTKFPDAASQPALSSDGRMMTFVRGPSTFYGLGQIYVKLLPDGEPKQITHDSYMKMSPVFSPDGSRIAYTTVDAQFHWDTWTVPVLGGEPARWLENAAGLLWKDSHTVLFSKLRIGTHMSIATAEESRAGERDVYVPAKVNGMAHRSYPSPDGKSALVVEMDGPWQPCRVVPMDGRSPGRPVGPPGAPCTFAAWSPDGRWMYLSSNAGGAFHIWRQRFPDGQPEQITSGPTEEEGIAMAADGRSLVTAVGLRQRSVMLHGADGERQVSLEGYAYNVKFTPDGKRLCFRILKGSQPSSDPTELWIADLDSGRIEALLPGFSLVGAQPYDISPDGREVVAAVRNSDGKDQLWLVPLDRRSPPRQIPNALGNWPLFGKEGEIFFRATDGFACRVRRDGTELRRVVELPVDQIQGLSPDSGWLAVWSADSRKEGVQATLVYPTQGGTPLRIFGSDARLRWSPDARFLFVSIGGGGMGAGATGRSYGFPLSGGRMLPDIPAGGFRSQEEMAKFPGVRVIDASDIALGPTPEVYALSRETTQRNLYRIPIQ